MFSPFDSALLLDFHILYIYAVFSNLQNSFSALFLFNVNKQGIYEIPKYILLQNVMSGNIDIIYVYFIYQVSQVYWVLVNSIAMSCTV